MALRGDRSVAAGGLGRAARAGERGEPGLPWVWGGDKPGSAASAPPAVTRGAQCAPRPRVGLRQRLRGQGRAVQPWRKGLSSPFREEETGLAGLRDLPQPAREGAGIQSQILFDSKSQTTLNLVLPKTKNWVLFIPLCFMTPAQCFGPYGLCISTVSMYLL